MLVNANVYTDRRVTGISYFSVSCKQSLQETHNVGVSLPNGRHSRLRLRGTSKYVNRELRWGVQLPLEKKKRKKEKRKRKLYKGWNLICKLVKRYV